MGHPHSQAAFAAALVDPTSGVPDGVTSARGEPDAARFAVYRNNVFVSLTRALAARFPVTERLVGSVFFAGMARVFAGERRPVSPLMHRYGDGFPDFIAGFGPAASLPYLPDVARIEAAWSRAYHAADDAAFGVEGLAALAPDRVGDARLAAHPSSTLIVSRHPAGSIWAAHQTDPVGTLASHAPETVLVTRPGIDVAVHVLPARDGAFAAHLFAGRSLGDAAQAASDADDAFEFGSALVGLVSLGAFRAVV